MSKGRGIITTFPPSDVDFFLKLLKVIHYLGNDLPIQILSNGHELSDKVIKQTSQEKNDKAKQDCVDAFFQVEPAKEEVEMINTGLLYTMATINTGTKNAEFTQMYFKELHYDISDSGLLVVKKIENLPGTLTGFMLMLNKKLAKYTYGDKEFYWMGPVPCASAVEIGSEESPCGLVTWLGQEEVDHLDRISDTWNELKQTD
ncbi:hypothetical protein C6P44_002481 [Monosporozyma unispora]|nr:hypothetical protein C6P44_002481 [Kazachstania unispora]